MLSESKNFEELTNLEICQIKLRVTQWSIGIVPSICSEVGRRFDNNEWMSVLMASLLYRPEISKMNLNLCQYAGMINQILGTNPQTPIYEFNSVNKQNKNIDKKDNILLSHSPSLQKDLHSCIPQKTAYRFIMGSQQNSRLVLFCLYSNLLLRSRIFADYTLSQWYVPICWHLSRGNQGDKSHLCRSGWVIDSGTCSPVQEIDKCRDGPATNDWWTWLCSCDSCSVFHL